MTHDMDSLYGSPKTSEPPPKAPGLMDQIAGLFTRPLGLFDDLHQAPSWVPAYLVTALAGSAFALTWVFKLDWLTFIAEQGAKAGRPAQSIPESALSFIKGIACIQVLAVTFGAAFVVGLVLWGMARWQSQATEPLSFGHAMSALIVPGLVKVPGALLGFMALVTRSVEHTPEWYLPTNLGFYLEHDSPKVQALYHHLDLLGLVYGVLGFLAMRRILKLPTWAALTLVLLYNALVSLWPILAAK